MTKHKIKIGFRDHRLGRILGEQAIELLKPHLSSAAFALVPVGVPRGRGHAAVWPGQPVEQALLRGEVDLAVQNMKDLSPEPPAGIVLAAVTERFTPFDALIARVESDAERAFQREITSDPTVPIGALAKLDGASLRLEGVIADREGLKVYRDEEEGKAGDEEQIGVRLARRLLLDGARALLTPAESSH